MTAKRVTMSARPPADPAANAWVRQGNGDLPVAVVAKSDLYTARLTIDVTPGLRGRIKVLAFQKGLTVAELLRALLEREFSESEGAA
ncbi:MAG: chromosome partitioning protein ParB [Gammaproteobacteria bacterium]